MFRRTVRFSSGRDRATEPGNRSGPQLLVGETQPTGRVGQIKPKHLVRLFVRNAAIVPTKSEVERQVVLDSPIILHEPGELVDVRVGDRAGSSRPRERLQHLVAGGSGRGGDERLALQAAPEIFQAVKGEHARKISRE